MNTRITLVVVAALAVAVVSFFYFSAPAPERSPPEPAPTGRAFAQTPTPEPTAAPTPDPAAEAVAIEARALLEAVIDREGGDPTNPWALAHGILARGRDFRATDGRLAVHALVDDFVEWEELPGRGRVPRFPQSRGDVRVEPHTDLVLRTLLEVGLPLDAPLTDTAGAPTLRALLEGSQARFVPVRAEDKPLIADPDDAPWSVGAWCAASQASGITSWESAAGPLELEEAASALMGALERETWFIRQAMADGQRIEKRKQGIFAFACGGAHLFGGVATCAAAGWPGKGNRQARLDALIDIYLHRVPLETTLVQRTMEQHPDMAPLLYNQDVKFIGHLLEALGGAERDGLWTPTVQERVLLDGLELRLVHHVRQLGQFGIYEAATTVQLKDQPDTFQFYLDLVGDACHAWRGLEIQAALRAR